MIETKAGLGSPCHHHQLQQFTLPVICSDLVLQEAAAAAEAKAKQDAAAAAKKQEDDERAARVSGPPPIPRSTSTALLSGLQPDRFKSRQQLFTCGSSVLLQEKRMTCT
jgi:hypothetical protein